jgi:glutathione S-transferase
VTLRLFAHPFSSYCQKALIAFYENGIDFEFCMLGPDDPAIGTEFAERWPIKRFPILVDGDRTIVEATMVIEYLQVHRPGPVSLIPAEPDAAIDVRMLDRFFDNYISHQASAIVFNSIRLEKDRDPYGDTQARQMLDTAYAWLDQRMANRTWASGETFSLADCAAAPSLFYADWTQPIPMSFTHVHAYRQRMLARPSFARAVDEARPYRSFFPLGAPDRD